MRARFWRFFIRRAALRGGFIDPVAVLSRLRRFAHPSEVDEPLELMRAGVIFHARGLINTRAIQHNLDWIWPYWVVRQFDPGDDAFIPRAFSVTHVNLTHRNWTATGLPGCRAFPIVDPRGLVTPFFDGWSIDAWIIGDEGFRLFPSHRKEAEQELARVDNRLEIRTVTGSEQAFLRGCVHVDDGPSGPVCRIRYTGRSPERAWLAIVIRPCNPEGISLVESIEAGADRRSWHVNGDRALEFDEPMERHLASDYLAGDVMFRLPDGPECAKADCSTGMATAAALFRMEAVRDRSVEARVFLRADDLLDDASTRGTRVTGWREAMEPAARLMIPDRQLRELYDASLSSLILLGSDDVYPGPYTYKRFWFRDAAFILNALLCAGLTEPVGRALARYPGRQKVTGFFHSQDGEWDSNGEALWIMDRYIRMTRKAPPAEWLTAAAKGARWILRKRLGASAGEPCAGLMPAGFSAEHLGPNDFYYWDNFWSVAGLRSAAHLLALGGAERDAREWSGAADAYLQRIADTLAECGARLGRPAMPAAPSRRLDAGAVGSLVAGYPLQLWAGDDPRLRDTAAFLLDNCFVQGGFFQEMIHSGINAYLTLHVAQTLLRSGDLRFAECLRAVADFASPTGQWPEAIHPRTRGGCMGDGHHAWASAEWVMMVRNLFVREEGDRVILGSGIIPDWQGHGDELFFGPTLTRFGRVSVRVEGRPDRLHVTWDGEWHDAPRAIEVALPEQDARIVEPSAHGHVAIPRRSVPV